MPLIIERTAESWTFILNRPEKMNALSPALVSAITEGLHEAHRQNVPLLIFKGNGKNFCAGFDFTDLETASEGDLLLRIIQIELMLDLLARSPAMTLAFCHGRNFGAGADIIAACKQRIAAPNTTFRFPGIKFGLILGTRRFQQIVGTQQALDILSSTRTFTSEAAISLGFIQAQHEPDTWGELIAQARENVRILPDITRQNLYQVLYGNPHADADLAALVRSAAAPGLKDRVRAYLAPTKQETPS